MKVYLMGLWDWDVKEVLHQAVYATREAAENDIGCVEEVDLIRRAPGRWTYEDGEGQLWVIEEQEVHGA